MNSISIKVTCQSISSFYWICSLGTFQNSKLISILQVKKTSFSNKLLKNKKILNLFEKKHTTLLKIFFSHEDAQ